MASEWMSGSIINRWLSEQEMSEGEKDAYLEVFTPSMRTYFAINSITNPLKAVERVKVHLDTTLSDANIAKVLDIDEADVVDVFTPGIRTHFAVNNISDPLQAIERVKVYLDTTLSDANIAEVLGIDEADAADIFTPSIRTHFAVKNISDPLKAIERVKVHLDTTLSDANIAEVLGMDEAEVANTFTYRMRTRFAVRNISDPLDGVKKYFEGKISYGGRYRAA
jgi:DNA-directed RNA polymerase specialized sigma subunit